MNTDYFTNYCGPKPLKRKNLLAAVGAVRSAAQPSHRSQSGGLLIA